MKQRHGHNKILLLLTALIVSQITGMIYCIYLHNKFVLAYNEVVKIAVIMTVANALFSNGLLLYLKKKYEFDVTLIKSLTLNSIVFILLLKNSILGWSMTLVNYFVIIVNILKDNRAVD